MWAIVQSVIQIIYLILKNKFEKNAELKKKKEGLSDEAKDIVKEGFKTRDVSRLNELIQRLR